MQPYAIVTDSSCDLSEEMAKELELTVVPLTVNMEGGTFANDLGWSQIDPHAFYNKLRGGIAATTSAPNIEAFKNAMRPLLQKGMDILYLGFSSGLSATFQSGAAAIADLREEFPERALLYVDTLCASLGEGLMLYLAVQKKRAGETLEAVRDYVETEKAHLCHWFTVDDLMYLKRGGRVGAATAVIGTILNIKPVMHVDDEGHLVPMSKAKGRKASLRALAEKMRELATEPGERTAFISHGDCPEDAKLLESMIRTLANAKNVVINAIGPVIGSHSGPGTVALFFLGSQR